MLRFKGNNVFTSLLLSATMQDSGMSERSDVCVFGWIYNNGRVYEKNMHNKV